MSRESFPLQRAERDDEYEVAQTYCEALRPRLARVAETLYKGGFPVDADCRMATREFSDLYSKDEIAADERRVAVIDGKISTMNSPERQIGELLEMAKTIAFNEVWFHKRLIAVRTAKYDDYVNGVDELVIDTETKTPVAVIDATTNWQVKAEALKGKISVGAKVKYGVELDKEGTHKISYDHLPLLVFSMTHDELLKLAADFINGTTNKENERLEKTVLEALTRESRQLCQRPSPIQSRYHDVLKVFEDLNAA